MKIYVTFAVPHLFQKDEKFAVACEDMAQVREVAQDANSLDGIKNIRFRKCDKTRNRVIIPYDSYWKYEWF